MVRCKLVKGKERNVNGKKVKVGDTVELTENQAKNWSDIFRPVDSEDKENSSTKEKKNEKTGKENQKGGSEETEFSF